MFYLLGTSGVILSYQFTIELKDLTVEQSASWAVNGLFRFSSFDGLLFMNGWRPKTPNKQFNLHKLLADYIETASI